MGLDILLDVHEPQEAYILAVVHDCSLNFYHCICTLNYVSSVAAINFQQCCSPQHTQDLSTL